MTAPDTNIPKQTKRHKPALIGITVAAVAVGVIFFVLGAFDWASGDQAAREPVSATAAD